MLSISKLDYEKINLMNVAVASLQGTLSSEVFQIQICDSHISFMCAKKKYFYNRRSLWHINAFRKSEFNGTSTRLSYIVCDFAENKF